MFAGLLSHQEICNTAKQNTPYNGIDSKYCNLELITDHIHQYTCQCGCDCSLIISFFIEDTAYDRPEETRFQTAHGKQVDKENAARLAAIREQKRLRKEAYEKQMAERDARAKAEGDEKKPFRKPRKPAPKAEPKAEAPVAEAPKAEETKGE